jgi:(Z)-2-((N-methylformamido)methylene)-5-hydroxybutyrolactone dehydrogenase
VTTSQPHCALFTGGAWRERARERRFEAISPYAAQCWATVAQAEPSDVADAVAAARKAFETVWCRTSAVLAVISFEDEEEAIRVDNDSRYGLATGVSTGSLPRAMRMTRTLQAGQIWVNTYRALAVQAPFGGFEESGFGREKGEAALNEFLATKNVMIDFSNDRRDLFAIRS